MNDSHHKTELKILLTSDFKLIYLKASMPLDLSVKSNKQLIGGILKTPTIVDSLENFLAKNCLKSYNCHLAKKD